MFNIAMYFAKRAGSDAAAYSSDIDGYSPERLALIRDLRQAIERAALVLHFQPKLNLATGRVDGVEVLVRPRRGKPFGAGPCRRAPAP